MTFTPLLTPEIQANAARNKALTQPKEMNMNELLDDYTKATFPLEVMRPNGGHVRLLAAIGERIVGIIYHPGKDGKPDALSQVVDWDRFGVFGNGQYPTMDLPPPPAMVGKRIAELEDERASAQGRLDGMPDAPAEWRGIDERRIVEIDQTIASLRGCGELEQAA